MRYVKILKRQDEAQLRSEGPANYYDDDDEYDQDEEEGGILRISRSIRIISNFIDQFEG